MKLKIVVSLFFVAFSSVSAFSVEAASDDLKIHVFYEALCPDSRRFITNQLVPDYEKLKGFVFIKFIPFGKSVDGGASFTCQHGSEECRLNTVQSCALANITSEVGWVKYVGCQMHTSTAEMSGERCTTEAGLQWPAVQECVKGENGVKLQLGAEEIQKEMIGYPSFVPTIVFNEKFDQTLQNRAYQGQFFKVSCELLKNIPPACEALLRREEL